MTGKNKLNNSVDSRSRSKHMFKSIYLENHEDYLNGTYYDKKNKIINDKKNEFSTTSLHIYPNLPKSNQKPDYNSPNRNISKVLSIENDINIFNIVNNFRNNLEIIKTLDHSHSNQSYQDIIKYTNFNSKCDLKVFSQKSVSDIYDIFKEYKKVKDMRNSLAQRYYDNQFEKTRKFNWFRQSQTLKMMFSIKEEKKDKYLPDINQKSRDMFENSALKNQSVIERLYKLKNNEENSSYGLNATFCPKINDYSQSVINSSPRLPEDFEYRHYNEYVRREERLKNLIYQYQVQYPFKPVCNKTNQNVKWDWDSFLNDVKMKDTQLKDKANDQADKDNDKKYAYMNENSVRILFEKGKFTDFDKKSSSEMDVFKYEDRLRLYNYFNDFHERLYDLDELNNKYIDLGFRQNEQLQNNLTNKPQINIKSNIISLCQKSYLEQINLYNRRSERTMYNLAREGTNGDTEKIYRNYINLLNK